MTTKRPSAQKARPETPPALTTRTDQAAELERSVEALAAMGDGEIAYLRAFRAGELRQLFPQVADLHPTVQLYALFSAEGTPLMIADTRDAVLTGAWTHDLGLAVLH